MFSARATWPAAAAALHIGLIFSFPVARFVTGYGYGTYTHNGTKAISSNMVDSGTI